jgi:hypothetical protein
MAQDPSQVRQALAQGRMITDSAGARGFERATGAWPS